MSSNLIVSRTGTTHLADCSLARNARPGDPGLLGSRCCQHCLPDGIARRVARTRAQVNRTIHLPGCRRPDWRAPAPGSPFDRSGDMSPEIHLVAWQCSTCGGEGLWLEHGPMLAAAREREASRGPF